MNEGFEEGQVLAGRYRIGKSLGRGCMGEVVAAEQIHLKERVAIKFMMSERCQDQDAVLRFLQEARAVRKIQSEHVVRVTDAAVRDDGVPYLVMEHLDGIDLGAKLARSKRVPLPDAASWIIQACEGIGEAHRMGIVHRDLKPANLFLVDRPDGSTIIKVLDFGISKDTRIGSGTLAVSDTKPSGGLTQGRAVLGSPAYMAPEQIESPANVDARSDIWSLGATLFELVAGQVPFTGDTLFQIYKNIVADRSMSWRRKLDSLPEGFVSVVAKCLTVNREGRYSTTAELAAALAPFASKEVPAARRTSYRRLAAWSAAAGLLLLTGGAIAVAQRAVRPSDGAARIPGIASALSGDLESTFTAGVPGPQQDDIRTLTLVDARSTTATPAADPSAPTSRGPVRAPAETRPRRAAGGPATAPASTEAVALPDTIDAGGHFEVRAEAGDPAIDSEELFGSQK
jgi:serine/threonine-protein kinase